MPAMSSILMKILNFHHIRPPLIDFFPGREVRFPHVDAMRNKELISDGLNVVKYVTFSLSSYANTQWNCC